MKKWVKRLLIIIVGIAGMIAFIILGARVLHASQTKIVGRNGIQEEVWIDLGGMEQYVQIRGNDKDNPIILFLHGGPASPHAYISSYYQQELEDSYTFVNWDQRGSGRTLIRNIDKDVELRVSITTLINDLDQLVDYLIERFGQEQVIIMGHSWGTVLGVEYIQQYPQKVEAYIGIGQVVDNLKAQQLITELASEKAMEAEDTKYVQELELLNSRVNAYDTMSLAYMEDMMQLRNKQQEYLPKAEGLSPFKLIWLGISSSDMNLQDIRYFLKMANLQNVYGYIEQLLEVSLLEFNLQNHSQNHTVPMYFICGEYDYITPVGPVEDYYNQLTGMKKALVIIEKAGHTPYFDDPVEFSERVRELLQK